MAKSKSQFRSWVSLYRNWTNFFTTKIKWEIKPHFMGQLCLAKEQNKVKMIQETDILKLVWSPISDAEGFAILAFTAAEGFAISASILL